MIPLDELRESLLGDWETARMRMTPTFQTQDGGLVIGGVATTALTMIGAKLLDEFADTIHQAVLEEIPGHIVETGVWRGGACIYAAGVLEALGSDKKVYVCDSFEGLPPATHPKETIDFQDGLALAVPLEDVQRDFANYGLEHRAVFVKGWFKDTMPGLDIPVAVLRMDGDLYESTMDVLVNMYDRVSPGGFVIVDDYQLPSCRLAVDEFRSRKHLRGSLKNRAGVSWRKPGIHVPA